MGPSFPLASVLWLSRDAVCLLRRLLAMEALTLGLMAILLALIKLT